jgi:hypothetical protein
MERKVRRLGVCWDRYHVVHDKALVFSTLLSLEIDGTVDSAQLSTFAT